MKLPKCSWLPGCVPHWGTLDCNLGAAADLTTGARRLFLNRNLSQLCICKKIRDRARNSREKYQRPEVKGQKKLFILSWWYHFQNENFRKSSFSGIIPFATVSKPSPCNTAKGNINREVWKCYGRRNLPTNNCSWGRGDKDHLNLASSATRHLLSFHLPGC